MSGKIPTYDRIYRYLKGLLSNRERHELEKDMMQDSFNEDAFEGISELTHDELDADMQLMMNRLDERIQSKQKRNISLYYRIAAGIALMIGLAATLYFLFPRNNQTQLLTQETGNDKTVIVPETSVPSVPDQPGELKPESLKPDAKRGRDAIDRVSGENRISGDTVKRRRDASDRFTEEPGRSDAMNSDRDALNRVSTAAPMAEYRKEVSDESIMTDSSFEQQYITGRVLGINRQALSGVSIMDQESRSVTRTDNQGNFRLPVSSSSSKIALRYNGYKSMEVTPKEIAGKEISMKEDRAPVKDLLVTGYGGKKSGAAGGAESKTKSTTPTGAYQYYKPVPAGGSFKAFEDWVESKIDVDKFMELLPGNYKIVIDLVVNADGTLSRISVKDGIPAEVADEYKRVVGSSDAWQPARANENPIDSEIQLIFSLIIQ